MLLQYGFAGICQTRYHTLPGCALDTFILLVLISPTALKNGTEPSQVRRCQLMRPCPFYLGQRDIIQFHRVDKLRCNGGWITEDRRCVIGHE